VFCNSGAMANNSSFKYLKSSRPSSLAAKRAKVWERTRVRLPPRFLLLFVASNFKRKLSKSIKDSNSCFKITDFIFLKLAMAS